MKFIVTLLVYGYPKVTQLNEKKNLSVLGWGGDKKFIKINS